LMVESSRVGRVMEVGSSASRMSVVMLEVSVVVLSLFAVLLSLLWRAAVGRFVVRWRCRIRRMGVDR
jgi:hypothetical protein